MLPKSKIKAKFLSEIEIKVSKAKFRNLKPKLVLSRVKFHDSHRELKVIVETHWLKRNQSLEGEILGLETQTILVQ